MIVDEKENAMYGNDIGVKVYVFELGVRTDPRWSPIKAKWELESMKGVLNGCEGLMMVDPVWPHSLAAFDTRNNAKAARDRLEAVGHQCGKNIMWGRLSKAKGKLEIKGKAEEQGG